MDDYLPGGYSPAIERVSPWIDEVCYLHSELIRRGYAVQRRIAVLSSESGWNMQTLLQECLAYPAVIPFVRLESHVRRAFQCQQCRIRECHERIGRRWCDFCLDREAEDREALPTVPTSVWDAYFTSVIVALREQGVTVDPGLTDAEIATIERAWSLTFPPDLAQLLRQGLPVSHGFCDWRNGKYYDVRSMLEYPAEETDWYEEARRVVAQEIARSPKLIPVKWHTYMPDTPQLNGNPVFVMHQTDVIYYGFDLPGFFSEAFKVPLPDWATRVPRAIQYWDTLL